LAILTAVRRAALIIVMMNALLGGQNGHGSLRLAQRLLWDCSGGMKL